jgi:hypothetical protein
VPAALAPPLAPAGPLPFAALPPLEGHPSMEDVFSPADLIVRPQRSFTGQERPMPGQRARCVTFVAASSLGTCRSCRRHSFDTAEVPERGGKHSKYSSEHWRVLDTVT